MSQKILAREQLWRRALLATMLLLAVTMSLYLYFSSDTSKELAFAVQAGVYYAFILASSFIFA
jgi:hypothetical protein